MRQGDALFAAFLFAY